MYYSDIAEHITAGKTAAEIATILQTAVCDTPRRLCYAVESGAAIAAVGDNPTEVLRAMQLDPNGQMLFQKLSSSSGVEWAHPATVPYLDGLVAAGVLSQAGRNALVLLSAPGYYRLQDATEASVQECIDAEAMRNWWNARSAVVADGLHSGTITTQQQAIDAIGGA